MQIRPQVSVALFGSPRHPEDGDVTVEPIPPEYIEAAKTVINDSVATAEASVDRLGFKALVALAIGGASLVVLNAVCMIAVNAIDNHQKK